MDRLLTGEDIYTLTGAKIPSKQRLILDKAGINYIERADGRPALTLLAVNAVLVGKDVLAGNKFDDGEQPDWAALDT